MNAGKQIHCCKGAYHIKVNDRYYCMAPPDIICSKQQKDAGKYTKGEKKIYYCMHPDKPCSECTDTIEEPDY